MPAPSSLPHPRRALSPEMHAITSEWISLTVGVPGRRSLAVTPPLPPLPEASVYDTDPLALSARARPSLPLSLPYSGRSAASPLALPPPHKAYSLAPSAQAPLHVNGDGGIHIHQDGFSQPPLGNSDRVISELSGAFSSQSKRQPWREDGPYERKAESEAGERCPGGPKISKKSCLKPSDVVRCLSSEQRLSEFHTPDHSQPFKPLGSPFPAWEAGPPELHRGVEADRKAAQSGVSQVGLKHDRWCLGLLLGMVEHPRYLTPGPLTEAKWVPVRCVCLPWKQRGGQEGMEELWTRVLTGDSSGKHSLPS